MRLIALLIMLIPGIIATLGIKLIRDTLFGIMHPIFFHISIQFIFGVLFILGGIGFIAGFIRHRDSKRKNTNGKF